MIPEILNKDESIPKEDRIVYFYLQPGDTNVALRARDDRGNDWYVLVITKEGIRFSAYIGPESGIPVDEDGFIEILDNLPK